MAINALVMLGSGETPVAGRERPRRLAAADREGGVAAGAKAVGLSCEAA